MDSSSEADATPHVVFVTRDGCTLCGPALRKARSVCASVGVPLHVSNLSEDDTYGEWSDDIPAVLIDGQLHSRWRVDQAALTQALHAASAPRPGAGVRAAVMRIFNRR